MEYSGAAHLLCAGSLQAGGTTLQVTSVPECSRDSHAELSFRQVSPGRLCLLIDLRSALKSACLSGVSVAGVDPMGVPNVAAGESS